jgi:hypothetical protein
VFRRTLTVRITKEFYLGVTELHFRRIQVVVG